MPLKSNPVENYLISIPSDEEDCESSQNQSEKSSNCNNNLMMNEKQYQSGSSVRSTKDLEIPSTETLKSWCSKQRDQLEFKRRRAVSLLVLQYHGDGAKEQSSEDNEEGCHQSAFEPEGRQYYISPEEKPVKVSPYSFQGDLKYFDQNKHPSIQEMIFISEESDVRYDKVFHRFSELRQLLGEKCSENDTCERVAKFFETNSVYHGLNNAETLSVMREDFKSFGHLGPIPTTGCIHLIVDKIDLPPDLVRTYYFKWYRSSQRTEFDPKSGKVHNDEIFEQELGRLHKKKRRDDLRMGLLDHDYAKNEATDEVNTKSLLRIIRRRPNLSVAEAMMLAPILKVDIKYIHQLTHQLQNDTLPAEHSIDEDVASQKKSVLDKKSREVIHVSPINSIDHQTKHKKVEETSHQNSRNSNISSSESDFPKIQLDYENPFDNVIEHEEEVGNMIPRVSPGQIVPPYHHSAIMSDDSYENRSEFSSHLENSKNRFDGDFYHFRKNRHPSIQEMIDISKKVETTYRQVFYRFREFRFAFNEKCLADDICLKVLNFFSHRPLLDGILDANSVNIMYEMFEKFGSAGRNPDTGYIHLVSDKVDLPPLIVRDQYKEWYEEINEMKMLPLKPMVGRHLESIHKNLEIEFAENSELTYERLAHLTRKYDITQKSVLNFFELRDGNIEYMLKLYVKSMESDSRTKHCSVDYKADGSIEKETDCQMASKNDDYLDFLNTKFLNQNLQTTSANFDNSDPDDHESYILLDSIDDSRNSTKKKEKNNVESFDFVTVKRPTLRGFESPTSDSGPCTLENFTESSNNIKFNLKKPSSEAPGIDRNSSGSQVFESRHQIETEDEEIDVVGLDENVKNAKNDVGEHQSINEFPDDIKLFEKNRHPSVHEMANISETVGIAYEKVLLRFTELRKQMNEKCPAEHVCQKFHKFNKIYTDSNGLFDEKVMKTVQKEFEIFVHCGIDLPLEQINLITEKFDISPHVVRLKYREWYKTREAQREEIVFNQPSSPSPSTIVFLNEETMKDSHFPKDGEDALKIRHEASYETQ